MPTHVACDECGLVLLALASLEPEPIDHDTCPECGGSDFSFLEEE